MTNGNKWKFFAGSTFLICAFQACSPMGSVISGQSSLSLGSGTPTTGGNSNNNTPPTPTPSNSTSTPTSGGTIPTGSAYLADPTVTGRKLEVCPSGCTYATVSAAAAAMIDGDTINVHYGDYTDCAWLNKNNIVIHGIPNASGDRPKMHGTVCGRKGILVVQGTNTLIENMELSQAQDTGYGDNNWAGIRFDDTGATMKIRNVYFHDSDEGILGNYNAAAVNTVVVESSRFERLGRGGYAHGMYIGSGVKLFVLRNSTVINNADDGHLVKSRAIQSILECNTIAGLDGANSYAIDLPQGGTVTIRSNVVEQGPHINNGGDYFIRFAEENANNAPHKLQVLSNYFVNDFGGTGHINIAVAADLSGWANNIFAGSGGSMSIDSGTNGGTFTNYPSRAAAGLPAYNGMVSSLPTPPACP